MIKDHPYADGCKRIAASLFLEFLQKNNALIRDGKKVISDGEPIGFITWDPRNRPEYVEIGHTAFVKDVFLKI